jgi:cell division septal protein FtsQ
MRAGCLLNLDWVRQAAVRVMPPNRLEVDVVEREPFAVWQRDGLYFVIDREGAAMASFDARQLCRPHADHRRRGPAGGFAPR